MIIIFIVCFLSLALVWLLFRIKFYVEFITHLKSADCDMRLINKIPFFSWIFSTKYFELESWFNTNEIKMITKTNKPDIGIEDIKRFLKSGCYIFDRSSGYYFYSFNNKQYGLNYPVDAFSSENMYFDDIPEDDVENIIASFKLQMV